MESCIPTPGIIVKGCIDDCDVCEPELEKKIQLELEEQELKNQLLKRQIELLDKSQDTGAAQPVQHPQQQQNSSPIRSSHLRAVRRSFSAASRPDFSLRFLCFKWL